MAKYDYEISILDGLIKELAEGEGDGVIEKNSVYGMPDDIAVIIWGYAHLEYGGDILPEKICFGKEYGREVFEELLSKREDYIWYQSYLERGWPVCQSATSMNGSNLSIPRRRLRLE